MPSGRTHDRITLNCLPLVAGLSWWLTHSGELALIIAGAFLFSGLMFGPDLDICSVQFKRWGKLRFLWLPYQRLVRHRSIWSHGLMIGTTLRVLYLLTLFAIATLVGATLARWLWELSWSWQQMIMLVQNGMTHYATEAIAIFLGLELGAMSHTFSDWLGSTYKRYQKRKGGGGAGERSGKMVKIGNPMLSYE